MGGKKTRKRKRKIWSYPVPIIDGRVLSRFHDINKESRDWNSYGGQDVDIDENQFVTCQGLLRQIFSHKRIQ